MRPVDHETPTSITNLALCPVKRIVRLLARDERAERLLLSVKDKIGRKRHGTFLVCGAAHWKHQFLTGLLKEHGANQVIFVHRSITDGELMHYMVGQRNVTFISWGMRETGDFLSFARTHDIPFWRIEDGFIRSVGLGAKHIPPASLIIDKTGSMYFRSDEPSELETFLETHSFTEAEIELAETMRNQITSLGLTKYNLSSTMRLPELDRSTENILIFGQVESDASIKYGSPVVKTNAQLIDAVLDEHPGARVFFRPHPDVAAGLRLQKSDVDAYRNRAIFLEGPLSVWNQIHYFDKVCVMTSLAGFEALMRGVKVRTYGMPFYAGWGITDDFLSCHRRTTRRSLDEIFYGTYIKTPSYIDPKSGHLTSLDHVMSLLNSSTESLTKNCKQNSVAPDKK